ncbi:nitroreductase [Dongia sp.]|uniref:nitroreductase family protein n=1 Tax=Dongia sp. TaxID=1977262 RepID=UPI0035B2EEA9
MSDDNPISALLSRRSVAVRRLGGPGPSPAELAGILAAATMAPDHGALRPWRLIEIGAGARAGLADIFVAAKRKAQPELTQAEIDRERDKALRPPVLIALVARPRKDHPVVTAAEQMATAGAAMQNILIAAHLLGYGAIILSGARCQDQDIRTRLGILPPEEFLGFISIGSIVDTPLLSRRPDLADMVTRIDRL